MRSRPPAIDALKTCAFLVLVTGSLSLRMRTPEGRLHPGDPDPVQPGERGPQEAAVLRFERHHPPEGLPPGRAGDLDEPQARDEGGGLVEEVLIRAGTPGIATEVGETSLAVSFEPGSSLMFGSPPRTRTRNGIQAVGEAVDRLLRGRPSNDGKIFYAVEGSGQAYLEVGVESLDAVEKKKKVLPGMTLSGRVGAPRVPAPQVTSRAVILAAGRLRPSSRSGRGRTSSSPRPFSQYPCRGPSDRRRLPGSR